VNSLLRKIRRAVPGAVCKAKPEAFQDIPDLTHRRLGLFLHTMDMFLPYTTALLLGSVHALEADHMAAVTAFAVRRPAPLAAAGFGVRWAAGHGVAVTAAGALLLVLGLTIPLPATAWLDRSVGLVLIALGVWTAWHASRLHAHVHHHHDGIEHAHLHSHAFRARHDHAHAAT
jgi:ABC-type nickel/cobalt efflux system permease component RcnA